MALTASEKVTVAEITLELYSVVNERAAGLNSDQILLVQDNIDKWEAVRDSFVKLKGGSDGVDFDNERKRQAIRQTVRKIFGLPLYSTEVVGESGSYALPNVPVW